MYFVNPIALLTISPMYFNIKHFFNYLKILATRTSRVVSRQAWQNQLQIECGTKGNELFYYMNVFIVHDGILSGILITFNFVFVRVRTYLRENYILKLSFFFQMR